MSTSATVPVFSPDGQLGDIPVERANEAVKAGFHVGVHVQSADGQDGIIPANRTAEAVKSGMKIVPIQDQPSQHPDYLSAIGSGLKSAGGDIAGLIGGAAQALQKGLGSGGLTPFSFMPMAANMGINDMQRAMDNRSTPYRAIAPVGETVGMNVRGMEESANQGDVGGVWGHAAAVPVAMAAGEILGRAPLGRIAKAGGAALGGAAERTPIVGPMAKGAILKAIKSWRASAPAPPETMPEISPSKVSSTPPESISKSSQLEQARALQNVPPTAATQAPIPAVKDWSTIWPRLQAIAQKIEAQGKPAPPAAADLTPAIEKSLPQARVEGKIMQLLRKGGGLSIGKDKLMDSLPGVDPETVQKAVMHLRDQGKIWHETTGGGAHPSSYTVALKAKQ